LFGEPKSPIRTVKGMIGPQQLLRIIIEMIFVLLGGLIVWLGVSGRIFFDRR
jgi:hypothetical protein